MTKKQAFIQLVSNNMSKNIRKLPIKQVLTHNQVTKLRGRSKQMAYYDVLNEMGIYILS